MKIFSVREIDRAPSDALDACDRDGRIQIRRRDGRTYTLTADVAPAKKFKVPDLRARWAKLKMQPISKAQMEAVDKLIAGE